MSVASWAAASSSPVGWVSLAAGVVVAGQVILLNARVYLDALPNDALPNRGVRFGAITGLLLVAAAAVLASLGGGRELWLSGLGGILCLTVAAAIQLRALQINVLSHSGRRVVDSVSDREPSGLPLPLSVTVMEAMQDINFLRGRVRHLVEEVERAAVEFERLLGSVQQVALVVAAETDRVEPVADFPDMAHALANRGLWAPVSVYTSRDDGTPLKNAVIDVLLAFEIIVVAEEPVERSSWRQRFWVRARSESVRERMRKLEQAFELQYLGKVRAEIDQAKTQAIATLLQAISGQDNAVVRIGSLIAIKAQGDLAVWTVSELEAADMERHSALLRDPVSALEYLRKLKREPNELPNPPDETRS